MVKKLPSTPPRRGMKYAINSEGTQFWAGRAEAVASMVEKLGESIAGEANAKTAAAPHDPKVEMYESDFEVRLSKRGQARARASVRTMGKYAANSEAKHKTLAIAAARKRPLK